MASSSPLSLRGSTLARRWLSGRAGATALSGSATKRRCGAGVTRSNGSGKRVTRSRTVGSAAPHLRLIDSETGQIHDAPSTCPHCAEAKAETEIWEKRVLQLERQVKRLTEDKDAKLRADKLYPVALDLIDEWKRECGHPNASASDPKRVQLALSVVKRYKD